MIVYMCDCCFQQIPEKDSEGGIFAITSKAAMLSAEGSVMPRFQKHEYLMCASCVKLVEANVKELQKTNAERAK